MAMPMARCPALIQLRTRLAASRREPATVCSGAGSHTHMYEHACTCKCDAHASLACVEEEGGGEGATALPRGSAFDARAVPGMSTITSTGGGGGPGLRRKWRGWGRPRNLGLRRPLH